MEQPNNTFSCDPYAFGSIATRCVVEHTIDVDMDELNLEVNWYYRDSSNGIPQEVPSGTANVQSTKACGLIKSDLMLQLADLDVGIEGHRYFCRVFLDGKMINDSQEVRLHSRGIVGNVLPACGVNESVQSELKRRCIDPITPDEPPKPTTTQPTNLPSSTSSLHMPTTLTSAIPAESPGPDVNNQGDDGETNVAGTPLSSGEQILIYVAIGVAVFLCVVVFLLVVCVCLWNCLFRQSK